jgi:hypothetical protein
MPEADGWAEEVEGAVELAVVSCDIMDESVVVVDVRLRVRDPV